MSVAVIFDLDDTLYPERSYNISGFEAVGDHVAAAHGIVGFAVACTELFRAGARRDIFDRAARQLGAVLPVADLVDVYRAHAPSISLFDDARQALATCRDNGPLGLLTDGYAAVQRRKVAALGINNLFASIVYSDDHGRGAWKPSEVPYRVTMANLADVADQFVYVGDNPVKDFVTARALGWYTVMVDRPSGVHRTIGRPEGYEADSTVSSLVEIDWDGMGRAPQVRP